MKRSEVKIGMPVIMWEIKSRGGKRTAVPVHTIVTSDPWERDGQVFCTVKGIPGRVCISRLEINEHLNYTPASVLDQMERFDSLQKIVDELTTRCFESESGLLINNIAFLKLKEIAAGERTKCAVL